jgi:hypothetical protein
MLVRRSLLAVAALSLGLGLNAAHATNLVLDGNFTSPSGGGYTTYAVSPNLGLGQLGPVMGPWTVTQGSVDLIGSYWQSPSNSGGSVDLDGYFQTGAISQTLNVTTPGLYTLSFELAGNPDYKINLSDTKTVQVTLGTSSQTFNFVVTNQTDANMGYILETSGPIYLGAGSETLAFQSLDTSGVSFNDSFGPVIGAVDVSSSVPEPSTWAMMILGFLGIGFVAYRRKKSGPALRAA